MTDIGNWRELVHCAKVRWRGMFENSPSKELRFSHYIMAPLTPYQMGNLLDTFTQVHVNGDWWGEIIDIIAVAMEKSGVEELSSNTGKKFNYEDVVLRNIRKEAEKLINDRSN